jgi:hypothetical protein
MVPTPRRGAAAVAPFPKHARAGSAFVRPRSSLPPRPSPRLSQNSPLNHAAYAAIHANQAADYSRDICGQPTADNHWGAIHSAPG